MLTFPNAKINIGLFITGKRPDGFHNIESIFYPLPLCDELQIHEASQLSFQSSGLEIPEGARENLCLQAFRLLQAEHSLPPVEIRLRKNIPTGAGLGGGSADGAFTLKMLNDLFRLKLDQSRLLAYAERLGSDCPFFIQNRPQCVTGRGELLEAVDISLQGLYLLVVKPPVFVSSGEAYAGVSPTPAPYDLRQLPTLPVGEWRHHIFNDFEKHLFSQHPEIARAKDQLYAAGATYAAMTGSGSAVYGIFRERPDPGQFSAQEHSWLCHIS
ncbi:MAG: 4-(cytidine 5'-diphospho)-2-C-methyl-D-erythritol kinase [Bacteroidia bacterium]